VEFRPHTDRKHLGLGLKSVRSHLRLRLDVVKEVRVTHGLKFATHGSPEQTDDPEEIGLTGTMVAAQLDGPGLDGVAP